MSNAPPPAWRRCSRQTFRAAKCEASHSSIITYPRVRADNNYVINLLATRCFCRSTAAKHQRYPAQLRQGLPTPVEADRAARQLHQGDHRLLSTEQAGTAAFLTVFKELLMMEDAIVENGQFVMDKATLKAALMKAAVPDWIIAKDFNAEGFAGEHPLTVYRSNRGCRRVVPCANRLRWWSYRRNRWPASCSPG